MPCEFCGASLDGTTSRPHVCSPERLAEFQVFGMRGEVESFEAAYWAFLDSPHGQFEVWLAEHQVHGTR
jgi:hypothetical protein